ncbi:hypothetical protein CPB84DRAFT_1791962 [Gymnopilus junonius]|uniref:Uncharacterized protein n=1 Tax=Gymnopilus junonius TaxID=109634 RepID=A0A9P5TJ39_GYMJU|nr:hypothetical protein CPB84DRAFT_1791962 [Gymnopilus junonius]
MKVLPRRDRLELLSMVLLVGSGFWEVYRPIIFCPVMQMLLTSHFEFGNSFTMCGACRALSFNIVGVIAYQEPSLKNL